MIKPYKKWMAYLALAGMCILTTGAVVSRADDLYNDSNVSIFTAVAGYVSTNDNAGNVDIGKITLNMGSTVNVYVVPTAVSSNMAKGDETDNTVSTPVHNNSQDNQVTQNNQDETPYVPPTDCKYPEYADKAVVAISSTVNIRKEAGTNCDVVGWAYGGQIVTVKSKGTAWTRVLANGTEGYIKNEFLAYADDVANYVTSNSSQNNTQDNTNQESGDTIAVINTSSLRLRESADINSSCLAYLPAGGSYLVLSEGSQWTQIQVSDSLKGYVHNDYISIKKGTPNNYSAVLVQQDSSGNSGGSDNKPSDIPTGGSGITSCTGQDIANYAVQYVGNPYVYGGTSLTEGADCSGFVMRVYADHGISLTRTAYYQASDGIQVSISQLVPGDLIIFDYGTGEIQHVGIYIGNNEYVHAANSSLGIIISDLNPDNVYTCRRIIY